MDVFSLLNDAVALDRDTNRSRLGMKMSIRRLKYKGQREAPKGIVWFPASRNDLVPLLLDACDQYTLPWSLWDGTNHEPVLWMTDFSPKLARFPFVANHFDCEHLRVPNRELWQKHDASFELSNPQRFVLCGKSIYATIPVTEFDATVRIGDKKRSFKVLFSLAENRDFWRVLDQHDIPIRAIISAGRAWEEADERIHPNQGMGNLMDVMHAIEFKYWLRTDGLDLPHVEELYDRSSLVVEDWGEFPTRLFEGLPQ